MPSGVDSSEVRDFALRLRRRRRSGKTSSRFPLLRLLAESFKRLPFLVESLEPDALETLPFLSMALVESAEINRLLCLLGGGLGPAMR